MNIKAVPVMLSKMKIITFAFAILPGLLAMLFITASDFSSAGALLNVMGRLIGIWGLALLLVAAILCCRVPGFDQPFGGLTKLWKLHHLLGAIGFLLILIHPLLLAFAAAELSLNTAVNTLFSSQASVLWGWVALIALMLFMAPTFAFFGRPDYQRWKWMHKLSGVTVVFALVHTLMLSRTLPGLWGNLVWGLMALMALSAIGYRWIFSRWRGRLPYKVTEITHPANNVIELTLQPQRTHLKYQPGQFVYLTPFCPELASGHNEEHPYTLSSSPCEPSLRIAIKALGDSSRALQNLAINTSVGVEGPYGRFFDPQSSPEQAELWIAGGIGITPFLARLRHHARLSRDVNVHLIYCVQDEGRLVFGDEIEQLCSTISGLCFTPHFFYRQGPLNSGFIQQHCPDFAHRNAYICGPVPLIDSSRRILTDAAVPLSRITTEEFVLL
jgi:predicted ferric reductase